MRTLFVVMASALCFGGCASVIRGTDEQIPFKSEPPDAAVSLSNGLVCPHIPCELKVARKDDFTATFTKDGFAPQSVNVTTHLTGAGVAAGAGNILVGGAIGVGVDAYNGANMDHMPNPVFARLVPLAPVRKAKKGVPVS